MNERIQELELEAIAYADSKVPAMDRYNDIYHSIVRGKFAELLLKASFDVVINDGRFHDAKGIIKAGKYTAMEHFGIEE